MCSSGMAPRRVDTNICVQIPVGEKQDPRVIIEFAFRVNQTYSNQFYRSAYIGRIVEDKQRDEYINLKNINYIDTCHISENNSSHNDNFAGK